jgi:hypothetical protein
VGRFDLQPACGHSMRGQDICTHSTTTATVGHTCEVNRVVTRCTLRERPAGCIRALHRPVTHLQLPCNQNCTSTFLTPPTSRPSFYVTHGVATSCYAVHKGGRGCGGAPYDTPHTGAVPPTPTDAALPRRPPAPGVLLLYATQPSQEVAEPRTSCLSAARKPLLQWHLLASGPAWSHSRGPAKYCRECPDMPRVTSQAWSERPADHHAVRGCGTTGVQPTTATSSPPPDVIAFARAAHPCSNYHQRLLLNQTQGQTQTPGSGCCG